MCYQFKKCGILVPTSRRLGQSSHDGLGQSSHDGLGQSSHDGLGQSSHDGLGQSSHDGLALVLNVLRLQPLRPDFGAANCFTFIWTKEYIYYISNRTDSTPLRLPNICPPNLSCSRILQLPDYLTEQSPHPHGAFENLYVLFRKM